MSSAAARLTRERKTIHIMMDIYCRENHAPKAGLCTDCQTLQDYADARLDRCPFIEDKPTCANCLVHCYKPDMRTRVKDVMRFSGPRMLWRHPVLTILHLIDGRKKPQALKKS